MAEQIRLHVELSTEQNIARGMSPEEARQAALRKFGGVEQIKEVCREERSFVWVDQLIQDLRYSTRALLRNPVFTTIAILTLALGLGANTFIFTVVNTLLLRPLPYENAERLVAVWDTNKERALDRDLVAAGNFLDWRKESRLISGAAIWYQTSRTLRSGGEAEQIQVAQVAGDFFQVLQMPPAHGKPFSPNETPGAVFNGANGYMSGDRVVVMSDGLWRRRFGGDPAIVSQQILLDGQSWRVMAIMPPAFGVPNKDVELWMPWDLSRMKNSRDQRFLQAIAQLKPEVTLEQAQSEMTGFCLELAKQFPKTNAGWGMNLVPFHDDLVGKSRTPLLVLFGAVGCVLLIVCANTSNLLLARATSRRREMAIRVALGAGRVRIIRQLLTETALLAVAGATLGIGLSAAALRTLAHYRPGSLPRLDGVALDGWVLGFTLFLAAFSTVASGLMPALEVAREDLNAALKDSRYGAAGSARHRRVRNFLVAGEIALALTLLAGAGLLVKSFGRILAVTPGFDPANVLVAPIFLDNSRYRTPADSGRYYQNLIQHLRALPSVSSVGGTTALPMSEVGGDFSRPYWRDGDPDPGGLARKAGIRIVTSDYFQTMRIPVLAGRAFTAQDRPDGVKSIVINQAMAREVWPGEEAVGKRLVVWFDGGKVPYEVIGIVGNTHFYGPKSESKPEVFFCHAQMPYLNTQIVVRTTIAPERLAEVVRREVLAVDAAQPVHSITTMAELSSHAVAMDRFATLLLGALAVVAVILAGVGIYGVTAYVVSQRTHEIGVRLALGASARQVLTLIVGQSMRVTFAGVGVGLFGAFALTRAMAGLLYEVKDADPITFGLVTLLLTSVSLLACWLPARRTALVSPLLALRCE